MDGLLPAATLRAGPPGHVMRASSVVAGLAFTLPMVPVYGYARVERLQGVAFTSSLPSTARTAWFAATGSTKRRGRPAMLLLCWALAAKPEDLPTAFQPDFVREEPLICIAAVVPLCQQDRVLCNGWVLDPLVGLCILKTLRAASFDFADSIVNCGTPPVATDITAPPCRLMALGHHIVRSAIISLVVPLSCH